MTSTLGAQVLAALAAERDSLRGFVALLEQEQQALITNQSDQLLDIAEKKSTHAMQLTELVDKRHQLLKSNLPELSEVAIQTWLLTQNKGAVPIWKDIRELVDQARKLNYGSGELIKLKLRYNQQALSVLSNAANKANLYGPDGQPSFATGTGNPIASA